MENEMNLITLKSKCINARRLTEKHPDSRPLQILYERAQRRVEAKEREVFCTEESK
jgi:hypothetical protein